MDLSIIIVNWNTRDLLRQCLNSIYRETKNPDFEVFVVDNHSMDKSAEIVKRDFHFVKLIVNKENLGFAKANNQALKQAMGDYILLLNPDTIILDKAIQKSVDYLKKQKRLGILGCKLLNPDRTWQPSCRAFPTLISQMIILLKIHNLFPNLIKKYLMLDMNPNLIRKVDQVMGAFLLTKREVIEKIGLLDERYWIWFEEVDFCKRAKEAGFDVLFWPKVAIIHHKAQSFNQVLGIKKQWHLNASMLRYFFKFHSKFSFTIILLLWPVSMFLALLVQFAQLVIPVRKKKYL